MRDAGAEGNWNSQKVCVMISTWHPNCSTARLYAPSSLYSPESARRRRPAPPIDDSSAQVVTDMLRQVWR